MKIFVINLDRASERLTRMTTILHGRGLEFERIPAVDGKVLSDEDLSKWSIVEEDGSPGLSRGELGCLMSHRAAWIRACECGCPSVVLEDDVHLALGAEHWLSREDWLPGDMDVVKFETTGHVVTTSRTKIVLDERNSLFRLLSSHLGCAGYIISPKFAERMLHMTTGRNYPVDHMLFDFARDSVRSFMIYQMVPALCVQDQFMPQNKIGIQSDIERSWIAKPRKSFIEKVPREARRLARQFSFVVGGLIARRRNLRISYPGKPPASRSKSFFSKP